MALYKDLNSGAAPLWRTRIRALATGLEWERYAKQSVVKKKTENHFMPNIRRSTNTFYYIFLPIDSAGLSRKTNRRSRHTPAYV